VSTGIQSLRRAILLPAVRDLTRRARTARAALPADSPQRQFYLGVESAAAEIIRPELSVSRSGDWLSRESPEFGSGYLMTSTIISDAMSADVPPPRLYLPDPDSSEP
jgi:hypothetical protein